VQLGETPDKADKKAPKPRRASLARAMTEDTVTLERGPAAAVAAARDRATPDDGEPIVANFGRFGPYVKHGDEFRSLERDDDVFSIGLDAAVDLCGSRSSRGGAGGRRTVLRELGPHPRSQAALRVLAGRYGPYVTDGTTNASLPKGTSPDALTLPEAADLLDARAAAGPRRRAAGSRRRRGSGLDAPKAEAARA
jgi:DNA topoisomerase I